MDTSAGNTRTVIIFNGGDALDRRVVDELPVGAYTIAADSGIEHALALEWPIDLAVGDFDSVSAAALAAAEASGARVERHPVAKDSTDLELALDAAAARRPDEIVVVGGHGGRVDHFLAAAL
ncbi:MAG: thiamine diphosphokinase, partial [Acidimicrobiales bacterium]